MPPDQLFDADDMRRAYEDGFQDGQDHGNLPWKYPPHKVAWALWRQHQPSWPALTNEDRELISEWNNMSYEQRIDA